MVVVEDLAFGAADLIAWAIPGLALAAVGAGLPEPACRATNFTVASKPAALL